MIRTICFCLVLFSLCPSYAQQKEEKSVTELQNRSVILNYIDDYCKAYANKDIDFFNDHYKRSTEYLDGGKMISSDRFLQNLNKLFMKNQDLRASVEDIKILQHPVKTDFYGVNVVMTNEIGKSTDKGYVFWLIDMRNVERMIIHVFSWQPYDTTPKEDVFGITDLELAQ